MTKRTRKFDAATTTYNNINTATTQHTDGIGGQWFFDGWMGTWTFSLSSATWKSTLTVTNANAGTWAETIAISSFPHNELGKDFRFNLRILHDTNGESYYWYKVNNIVITFPSPVSYALHNDYKRGKNGGAANTVLSQANQLMNVANAEERVNIIPPLDLGTWDDVSFLRKEDWVRDPNSTNDSKFNRINGYLDTKATGTTGASWCTGTDAADENFCATKFKIDGLMNTYDEHFAAQQGNLQEIWIQLSYAARDNAIVAHSSAKEDYVVEAPFPYMHFHATEISSIAATCSTTGVYNGNLCTTYATNALHKGDGPYGG